MNDNSVKVNEPENETTSSDPQGDKKTKKIGGRLSTMPWSIVALMLPAALFFLAFMIVPLIVVVYYSLQPSVLNADTVSGLSLANFTYFFSRPYYVGTIYRTLRFALISTFFSMIIGYTASLVLRKVSERLGNTAVLLLAFPILSGPIVTIMGWMIMLTSGGAVGRTLAFIRETFQLENIPTLLLGTDTAVIIGLVHFNLAFVILNLLNVMLVIPPELEEAAMTLGANRWQVFRRVVWPLSLPGVFSATLISLALSMNAFVNPMYLGNASRPVMTTQISQFMLASYNWQMASTTSVILLLISTVAIIFYDALFGRAAILQKGSGA